MVPNPVKVCEGEKRDGRKWQQVSFIMETGSGVFVVVVSERFGGF